MRRKKKKGESVCSCTRTGKKKRLRRQSGLKEEQKEKNYDPFQFMQRRNLSFLLFSLNLLLGRFSYLKRTFDNNTVHSVLCVFFLPSLFFIYFVCAKRRRRQNLGIPLILMYVSLSAMRNLFMYVLFKGLI